MAKRASKYLPIFAGILLLAVASCDKGTLKSNAAPDTFIALESINLEGQNRLNSVVKLGWFGTDVDGVVLGYEVSFDQISWQYTTSQDSVFRFEIPEGSDTVDVTLFVRSIDDRNATDPTPAQLRIPLKNSLPSAIFDVDNLPTDTAICVATYRWKAEDPDGDNTIVSAEMRWNTGDWFTVDPRQPLITFVADTTAGGLAKVYYANNTAALATKINGVVLGQQNQLFVRVKDIAGAYSEVDTAAAIFIRKPSSKMLVICGQPQSVSQVYIPILQSLNLSYDFVDYAKDNGANQPKFWSPTFRHLLMLYGTAFIYTDASTYSNSATGQNALLLNFMGQGVQQFTDAGRKLFVSTIFANTSDIASIAGIYPIEDIVRSAGQVRISNDSAIYNVVAGSYPNVQPQNIVIGLFPIVKSADAEAFYRAQLTKISGWQGDNLVASRRKIGNKVNHVFFGVGLFQFTKNPTDLKDLFEDILIDDFNW